MLQSDGRWRWQRHTLVRQGAKAPAKSMGWRAPMQQAWAGGTDGDQKWATGSASRGWDHCRCRHHHTGRQLAQHASMGLGGPTECLSGSEAASSHHPPTRPAPTRHAEEDALFSLEQFLQRDRLDISLHQLVQGDVRQLITNLWQESVSGGGHNSSAPTGGWAGRQPRPRVCRAIGASSRSQALLSAGGAAHHIPDRSKAQVVQVYLWRCHGYQVRCEWSALLL